MHVINRVLKYMKRAMLHIDVDIEKCIENTKIKGYESMIVNLTINLFSNALNAITKRFADEKGGILNVVINGNEKELIMYVSDNGVGMSAEKLNGLLGLKVNQNTPDTLSGVGQMMNREYIDKHNGKIEVESKPELGTTFKIFLARNS